MILEGNIIPTIGCRDLDDVIDRLELAVKSAQEAGISSTNMALSMALSFLKRQTSILGRDVILIGGQCEAKVKEANGLLSRLNAALEIAGYSPVPSPERGGLFSTSGLLAATMVLGLGTIIAIKVLK